jgi:hypothetical protein
VVQRNLEIKLMPSILRLVSIGLQLTVNKGNIMDWFEVISIRLSSQGKVKALLSVLRQFLEDMPSSVRLDCFSNADIESDWSFILGHGPEEKGPQKTRLGRLIAEALKPFGLVNHMVWVKNRFEGCR